MIEKLLAANVLICLLIGLLASARASQYRWGRTVDKGVDAAAVSLLVSIAGWVVVGCLIVLFF